MPVTRLRTIVQFSFCDSCSLPFSITSRGIKCFKHSRFHCLIVHLGFRQQYSSLFMSNSFPVTTSVNSPQRSLASLILSSIAEHQGMLPASLCVHWLVYFPQLQKSLNNCTPSSFSFCVLTAASVLSILFLFNIKCAYTAKPCKKYRYSVNIKFENMQTTRLWYTDISNTTRKYNWKVNFM